MLRIVATSSAVFIAAAVPALAEVTPAQVWENLSGYYEDMGYQVEVGSQQDTGTALELTDVVIRVAEGDHQMSVSFTMPSIVLRETGDEKVRSVIEGDLTGAVTGKTAAGEDFAMDLTIAVPGNEMTTSGTPEEMVHEYSYPTTIATISFEGTEGIDGAAPLTITLNNMTGSQTTTAGQDATETSYDLVAETGVIALGVTDMDAEDGTGQLRANIAIDQLAMAGKLASPQAAVDLTNKLGEALAAGFATDAKLTTGAIRGDFAMTGQDADGAPRAGDGEFTAETSELTLDMSADGLEYEAASTGMSTVLNLADAPFPISYQIARGAFGLGFPVRPSDEPQPFAVSYELEDLTLAEDIWNLFDAEGKLSRDPASFTLDLDGTMLVTRDIFDPAFADEVEAAENSGAAPETPWIPKTLTINRVALDAIGATADVTGALEFGDNPQEPVGSIDGSFSGVNALLDNLSAIGVLNAEQVMPVRMMMAMFARPVDGEADKFETQLEFREGGSIFANGQQVR